MLKISELYSRRRLSDQELEFLVRQLGALLQAGIPIDRALQAIAMQMRPGVQQMLLQIRERIREGIPFHKALGQFQKEFPESLCGLVAVGEASGNLQGVLGRVAEAMNAANQLRYGLFSAMAYPFIVTFVAIIIIVVLMSYVVPQIVSVLASQQQALPMLTRVLIEISGFLSAYGAYLLLFAIITGVVGITFYTRSIAFRLTVDGIALGIPILGPLWLASQAGRLSSALSISLLGGVSLVQSLITGAKVLSNQLLRSRIEQTAVLVREGAELARALSQLGGFHPLLIQLIATGERGGELPKMLDLAANQFHQEVRRRISILTTFLEPILILGMGLLVLLIVLAVMMPLIEINAMLQP